MGAPNRKGGPPAARVFPLPQRYFSPSAMFILGLLGCLCILAFAHLRSKRGVVSPVDPVLLAMLAVLAFGVASIVLLRARRAKVVVVGADGVLLRDQFIPLAQIASVRHHWRLRDSSDEHTGGTFTEDVWTVSIALADGDLIEVVTLVSPRVAPTGDRAETMDEVGASLSDAIEGSLAEPAAGLLSEAMARHEGSGAAWLRALRRLGAGGEASYRGVALDVEQLSRTLDDVRVRPSIRAAAAVVLRASGDKTAASKLRLGGASMADPRLRIALNVVAKGSDDAAIAEALEALDEADHPKAKARTM